MNREEIVKKINEVLIDILDDDTVKITDSSTTNDIDGWDSITKMMFISGIEEEFNIKLSSKDVFDLNEFGTFADTIIEKISKI